MTIYAFYFYNRNGVCLLYRRFHQAPKSHRAIEHETKLMWGLLFSMKDLVKSMTPRVLDELEQASFQSFTTHDSKVHYYETLTGLRFVLTTDTNVAPARPVIEALYHCYVVFVDTMIRNPLFLSCDDGLGAATTKPDMRLFVNSKQSKSQSLANGHSGADSDASGVAGSASGSTSAAQKLEIECPVFVDRIIGLIESLPYFH